MRGRKPIPTVIKIARGNPGQRRLNDREPEPAPAVSIEPPAFLNDDARAEWVDKAPMLERLGLLTEADLDAFAVYCQTFARWKHAEKQLLDHGMVVLSSSNNGYPIISPWLAISNKAQAQATRMLIEFGLTPSARSRVAAAKSPSSKKHNEKKERFFGRPRSA